jgi:hypothetical protein
VRGLLAAARFPSPLIKPDVPVTGATSTNQRESSRRTRQDRLARCPASGLGWEQRADRIHLPARGRQPTRRPGSATTCLAPRCGGGRHLSPGFRHGHVPASQRDMETARRRDPDQRAKGRWPRIARHDVPLTQNDDVREREHMNEIMERINSVSNPAENGRGRRGLLSVLRRCYRRITVFPASH